MLLYTLMQAPQDAIGKLRESLIPNPVSAVVFPILKFAFTMLVRREQASMSFLIASIL